MSDVQQYIQLGFAGGVAVYLLVFMVKDVRSSQNKMLNLLECIAEALKIKRGR